ncbi:MAG: glycosyltransferase family 39 protein [Tepidisphaeraceae bacterium]|jgi:uncharacterized membrane protein
MGLASPRTGRYWWALAWLGLAVGVCFRVCHLGRESLWFDEGYTAWIVSHPPGEIIRLILADTAPPLYYLLLHGWTEVFGRSEIALRSLSTACSILTLLVGFGIARRMLRNPAAVAAAMWLLSFSFLQTWYAREARAYALMALLGVAGFDWLQRHLAAAHRRWLIPMTLLIATEMYTHNMMAPYAMGLMLAWLVLPSEHSMRRRIAEISLVTGVAAALYLPWAIGGLRAQMDMIQHAFWVDPLKRGNFLMAIVAMLGVQHYWSWTYLLERIHLPLGNNTRPIFIGGCLLIASAFLSMVLQKGACRRAAVGLLVAAMFPPVFVALYSVLRTPLATPKLFLPSATLLPIFVLLPLGMPLSRWISRAAWGGTLLLLLLSGLTLYSHYLEDNKENWRAIAQRVSELPAERRLIVFVANDGQLPFDYYYHYRPGDEATGVPRGFFDRDPPRTMLRVLVERDLWPLNSRLASGHYDQVVLVLAHQWWADTHHLTQTLLRKRWPMTGHEELNDVAIQWYEPNGQQTNAIKTGN